jgi:arylsulfatase A-like enzyme
VPSEGACPNCNVILISLDTVRADHLGAYGNDKAVSPNFDRLAKKSVLFERAISQTAWTLPGHGSMMTGLYPKRLGVEHYPPTRRLPDVPMLAEQFKTAGYATAAFTGGGFVSDHWGFDRGFDVYSSDGRRFEHNIDEAMSWLRANSERKFFLFLHGYDAHRPYYSSAEDKKAVGLGTKRAKELSGFCGRENRKAPPPAQLETIKKFYDASIHHGDVAFGQYLDTFEELGLMDNTVILVTSDHGEEFFEHGNCDHVRFLYQEVVGVPYLIYVPGMTPGGDRTNEIVPASISVAPTLLELAGIEHNMPGASVVPVLNGERGVCSEAAAKRSRSRHRPANWFPTSKKEPTRRTTRPSTATNRRFCRRATKHTVGDRLCAHGTTRWFGFRNRRAAGWSRTANRPISPPTRRRPRQSPGRTPARAAKSLPAKKKPTKSPRRSANNSNR